MFMYALVREAAAVAEAPVDEGLAFRAHKELGYTAATTMASEATKGNQLRMALRELGIQPFTPESVARYQERMRRCGWQLWAMAAALMLSGVAFEALRAWTWVLQPLASAEAQKIAGTTSLIVFADIAQALGCVGRVAAPIAGLILAGRGILSRVGEWRVISLARCELVVPSFALDTALKLRTTLPGVNLHISYYVPETQMREEREAQRRADDPFLVVSYGDYRAYVEVWDEPGFNQVRRF